MHRTLTGARLFLALSLVAALSGHAAAVNDNFIFLSRLDQYTGYNDVWGYRDPGTGEEYAILGTRTGTSIVNVSDPFNPYETGFIPGPPSIWRDMHTYQSRAYAVSEGIADTLGNGGGLQIISLADPEAPFLIRKKHSFTAHTIWIDEAAGVAYCNGSSGLGVGFKAYNLVANPDNPPLIEDFGGTYIHDIWVGGGVAYTADINNGGQMRLLDVSALPAGTQITQTGIVTYANGATHNTWPHPDGIHVLTTDERTGGTVRVFDVSDPGSILEISQFPVVTGTSVHNVYMVGDTAYCSWYASGIRAFDVSDPFSPAIIGNYDTSPAGTGFNGCWSVYPFLPSGVILCADMSEGLVAVAYSDQIGTISGTVTRAENGTPIVGATVNVPAFYNKTVLTDGTGHYSFQLPGGVQSVDISFPGYVTDSQGVTIVDGLTTTHNVALTNQATGVGGTLPAALSLSEAMPNPTRGIASVDLALPKTTTVRFEIFDASGRRVRSLVDGALPAGPHRIRWDGADASGRSVPSGTYFYRVDAAGEAKTVKVTVLR